MLTVYKYPISRNDTVTALSLPIGAEILKVDVQENDIFLWAKVNTEADKEIRIIEVFGTGHSMPDCERIFLNTFFSQNGMYVFHAFERL